jgi:hypothetical protein
MGLNLSIRIMDKLNNTKAITMYEQVPCPKCRSNKCFPFTNDGGSILVCQICKHLYPAKRVTKMLNVQSFSIPDSWGNFASSSSDFATLENMNNK